MEQYGKAAIVHPTGKWESYIANEMTLGEAVVRGILPTPNYVTTVYQYQKALAKYQARVDNLRTPGIQDANQKYLDAPNTDKAFADFKTDTSDRLKLAQEPKRKSESLNVLADHKTGEGLGLCSRSVDPE